MHRHQQQVAFRFGATLYLKVRHYTNLYHKIHQSHFKGRLRVAPLARWLERLPHVHWHEQLVEAERDRRRERTPRGRNQPRPGCTAAEWSDWDRRACLVSV